MVHSAPAAIIGSLFQLVEWFTSQSLSFSNALFEDPTDSLTLFKNSYPQVLAVARDQYLIPVLSSPQDQRPLPDQQIRRFTGLPAPETVMTQSDDILSLLPSSRQIFGHINNHNFDNLLERVKSVHPSHGDRLKAVASQSFNVTELNNRSHSLSFPRPRGRPPRRPPSSLPPNAPSQHQMLHNPMSHMILFYPTELRNETFIIVTSIQCGVRITWSPPSVAARDALRNDPYGDTILNTSTARIPSHDSVVMTLSHELRDLGIAVSCKPNEIPRCPDPLHRHEDLHGDIVIFTSGFQSNPIAPGPPARVVLDVSIVHSVSSTSGSRIFKQDSLIAAERVKRNKYCGYHTVQIDFVPLIGDSFGRLSPATLQFFWRVASTVGARADAVSRDNLLSPLQVFNRLRLRFLTDLFEATSFRLMHGTSAFQMPLSAAVTPSPSLPSPPLPSPPLPSLGYPSLLLIFSTSYKKFGLVKFIQ